MFRLVLEQKFELDGISPDQDIALTLSKTSFETLTQRGGTISTKIELARTTNNRLQLRELEINVKGDAAYQFYEADLYIKNELVFQGACEIVEAGERYLVRLFDNVNNPVEQLKGLSIRDLDLSQYNHLYTAANVNSRRQAGSPVFYPNIDYGRWRNEILSSVPYTDFKPAVYISTLLEAAFKRTGFTIKDYSDDYFIPYSLQDNMVNTVDTPARIELTQDVSFNTGGAEERLFFELSGNINYSIENDPGSHVKTTGGVVDEAYYEMRINGNYNVKAVIKVANVTANGAMVIWIGRQDSSGNTDLLVVRDMPAGDSEHTLFLDGVELDAGKDELAIYITTTSGNSGDVVEGSFIEIDGAEEVRGQEVIEINVAETLPDISVEDLIKYVLVRDLAILINNPGEQELRFVKFKDIVARYNEAPNWNDKIDYDTEPKWRFVFENYAQENEFRYEEQDTDDLAFVRTNLKSVLEIENRTLDKKAESYTAPFRLTGLGPGFAEEQEMPLIARYTIPSVNQWEADINPGPRVLRVNFDKDLSVDITGESTVSNQANADTVNFPQHFDDHYTEFQEAMRQPVVLEAYLYFDLSEIRNLDITKPVFLLNSYWFILKLDQFNLTKREPTLVKLLKLF